MYDITLVDRAEVIGRIRHTEYRILFGIIGEGYIDRFVCVILESLWLTTFSIGRVTGRKKNAAAGKQQYEYTNFHFFGLKDKNKGLFFDAVCFSDLIFVFQIFQDIIEYAVDKLPALRCTVGLGQVNILVDGYFSRNRRKI